LNKDLTRLGLKKCKIWDYTSPVHNFLTLISESLKVRGLQPQVLKQRIYDSQGY